MLLGRLTLSLSLCVCVSSIEDQKLWIWLSELTFHSTHTQKLQMYEYDTSAIRASGIRLTYYTPILFDSLYRKKRRMSNEADRGNGTKDVHRIYLSLTIVETRQFCT